MGGVGGLYSHDVCALRWESAAKIYDEYVQTSPLTTGHYDAYEGYIRLFFLSMTPRSRLPECAPLSVAKLTVPKISAVYPSMPQDIPASC